MYMCFIEPPRIQYAGATLNETILAGFQIQLKCKATGSPLPGESYYISSFLEQYQILASLRGVVSDLMPFLLQL